jgi:hypothetical protein
MITNEDRALPEFDVEASSRDPAGLLIYVTMIIKNGNLLTGLLLMS